MRKIIDYLCIKESENLASKKYDTEELSNGYSIIYKHGVEKLSGDFRGLHLSKYFYAELHKDGKRVDWTYADSDAKKLFDTKIKEWKKQYS